MKARVIVLIAIVLAFFHFSTLMILGPEYDESLYVNTALGCPNKGIFDTFVKEKFGTCWPIMVSSYLGSLPAYLWRVVFRVFGVNVLVLRLLPLILYLAVMWLVYRLVRSVFDQPTAWWTVFLLLFDFSFSVDSFYESIVIIPTFLRVLSVLLFLFAIRIKKHQRIALLFSGVLFGITIWTKLDSLFFYGPLMLAGALIYRPAILKFKSLYIGVLLGCSPFLFFLAKFHTQAISAILTVGHTGNVSFIDKIYVLFPFVAYQQFQLLLYMMPRTGWMLAGGALFVLILFICLKNLRHNDRRERLLAISLLFFYVLYLILPSLNKNHHAQLMVPIAHVLIARFIARRRQTQQLMIGVGILLLFAFQYNTFLHTAKITCGYRNFACGIYDLQDQTKRMSEVVIYDWGIATQFELLTKGVVVIHEIAYDTGSMLEQHIQKYMDRCLPFIAQSPAFFTSTVALTEVQLYGNPKYQRSVIDAQGNQYVVWSCTTTPPTLPSR